MNIKFRIMTLPALLLSLIAGTSHATESESLITNEINPPEESQNMSELASYLISNKLITVSPSGQIKIQKGLFESLKKNGVIRNEMTSFGTHTAGGGCKSN